MTESQTNRANDPQRAEGDESDDEFALPVEVELYIQPDGSVVFADLAADVMPIAKELDPDVAEENGDDT